MMTPISPIADSASQVNIHLGSRRILNGEHELTTIAVSSFSLFSVLGPLHLESRNEKGVLVESQMPLPQEHTLEEFVALARTRLGVDAVELCQIQFHKTDDAQLDSIRAALDSSGVRLLTVSIDTGNLSGGTPEQRAEDVEHIEHWIAIAARLGATFVRVNTGSPITADMNEDRAALVEALTALSNIAHDHGLQLLIENHGGLSSDPDYLLAIREQVGQDRLGILLDLGNFEPLISVSRGRLMGANPNDTGLNTDSVYENIAKLAPVARLVHVKAHDPASDGSPLLDLDKALQIVTDSDRPDSIEWEGLLGSPWDQTARVLSTVRSWLAQQVDAHA